MRGRGGPSYGKAAAGNYTVLACDYDGTLASNGTVDQATVDAVRRWCACGRRFVLVTGRELDELLRFFPQAGLCDRIVAENGAVLYRPATGESRTLASPPPESFFHALRERRVQPLAFGRVIVATREPHQTAVLQTIHDLGLELQVIFNKGAVMVLPSGINKATGLKAVLKAQNIPSAEVAGVGDAENDHALLEVCGFSVAVANAIPALKEHADWVTPSAASAGVRELIARLLKDVTRRKSPSR